MKISPTDIQFIQGLYNSTFSNEETNSSVADIKSEDRVESRQMEMQTRINNHEQEEEYAEHCLDCFDSRKDLLTPQHIDYFPIKKFRENNKPYKDRDWLYCFHGAMKHDLYSRPSTDPPFHLIKAGNIRAKIMEWIGRPRASIGNIQNIK